MEQYIVDLEIAKQLKEVGFPQETEYFLYDRFCDGYIPTLKSFIKFGKKRKQSIASPITEEILKELPFRIEKKEKLYDLRISKDMGRYYISYVDENERWENDEFLHFEQDKKLSNVLAKIYIWLKEEKLI